MSEFGQRYKKVSLTIANGGTTTGAFDREEYDRMAILFPSAFTGTAVTFTGCDTADGTFVTISGPSITEAASVAISPTLEHMAALAPFRFLKVVSGSAEGAARTLVAYLARE